MEVIFLNNIVGNNRVAVINDMSGIGKCSLTVAIPIFSCLKLTPCPFPTAILSSQTGYPEFTFLDFTEEMINYEKVWDNLQLKFKGIHTGFLGSEKQIEIVENFIKKHEESLVLVDPVMADNGSIYGIYTESMCNKIKNLVSFADVVTPNATESLILANENYKDYICGVEHFKDIAKKISNMGPKKVVITGIIEGDMISNLAYDRTEDRTFIATSKYNKTSYSGTGDIFSSILCGMLLNGFDLEKSVKKATDFIYKTIQYTSKFEIDTNDGIMFEIFLKELIL